jgi:hypothetical protein
MQKRNWRESKVRVCPGSPDSRGGHLLAGLSAVWGWLPTGTLRLHQISPSEERESGIGAGGVARVEEAERRMRALEKQLSEMASERIESSGMGLFQVALTIYILCIPCGWLRPFRPMARSRVAVHTALTITIMTLDK